MSTEKIWPEIQPCFSQKLSVIRIMTDTYDTWIRQTNSNKFDPERKESIFTSQSDLEIRRRVVNYKTNNTKIGHEELKD